MYSNNDGYELVLFLKDGILQVKYYSLDNVTSQLIFNDNQTINDGQQHYIFISHNISETISNENMYINIDKRSKKMSAPVSSSLFFNIVAIGGSYHMQYNNAFVGCFANITYNYHPLLPEGIVKSDRYDCFYDHDSICDREIPCSDNQSLDFCGQTDCSIVCTSSSSSSSINVNKSGLFQYITQIESGQYEQIHFMIFTQSANSTLFLTRDGSIQVSIVLQVSLNK